MTFDPNQKRGGPANAGNWTKYENSLPEADLPDLPVDASVTLYGRDGRVLSVDNGTHMIQFENGDLTLASKRDLGLTKATETAVKLEAIAKLHEQLADLHPYHAKQMDALRRQINTGCFGDISDVAWFDIRLIEQHEAAVADNEGRDSSDFEEVNPARAAAEKVYDDKFYAHRMDDRVDEELYSAMSAFHDASVAVAYRNYIDDPRYPGFNQESYDHMTRVVRQVAGPVHPGDELVPASWAKRYGCVTASDHIIVGGDDPYCSECGKELPNIGGKYA